MMRRALFGLTVAAALLGAASAEAACGAVGSQKCTVGTGAVAILNAYAGGGGGYRQVAVINESTTATIAVCWVAGCTPSINANSGDPSYTIPPGKTRLWRVPYGSGGGYNDAMTAIASASSTPVTVEAR